jgi:Tfp pilus assembly protein PilO
VERGEVIALLAVVAGWVVILFPLVRALAERIRPRAPDTAVRDDLQALREDLLAELQHARREIGDLNERIDFTERLLAKKTER